MTPSEQRGVLLDLLREIDAFCSHRGLTYYAYGGTLLGAVRHHGFIPWDDDVDLMMPRADYERFCRDFPASGATYVASRDLQPDFPYAYAKVCRRGTVVREDVHLGRGAVLGVNVDVFPLDVAPASGLVWHVQRLLHSLARAALLAKVVRPTPRRAPATRAALWLAQVLLRPVAVRRLTGLRTAVASLHRGRSAHRAVLVTNLAFRVHEHDLAPARHLDFEDMTVRAPRRSEELLTRIYGDYLTPPPEADRRPPHPSQAFWAGDAP